MRHARIRIIVEYCLYLGLFGFTFCTDMGIMDWLQTALGFACVISLAILFYADSKEWMINKSEQKKDSGYVVFDKLEYILLLANSVLVVLSYYATFFFTEERHAWIALTFASSEVLIIIEPRILRWMTRKGG